ncbi:MAG: ABC transporter substrate-binding protein [Firmicutes bacterium]|nr:ABC transporter substrate-binding protein [Bacillota bacterium]
MKRLIFIMILCLSLSGCLVYKPNSGKTRVTVVLDWVPNTNHTGMYLAKDLGYYAEEGLEVNIIQPPEDGAVPLVASGKADFGISFQEELAFALTADVPLPVTAVAAILQHNTSGIISLKEKGITSPKKMENKIYATWSAPIEQAILKNVIEADGGDFQKVKMVPTTVTDVAAAIQTNIDAVWVYYGWDGVAMEEKGLETNFFAFSDINAVLDFYTPIVVSGNDYLKDNADTAKKFLNATAKGYQYAVENPVEAAQCIVKNVSEMDISLAQKSQMYLKDKYIADAPKWGVIDAARWSAFYDWLYDSALIPIQLGEQGFTNEYLQR